VSELNKRRAAAPENDKPFEKMVTILDLLPKDQPKKLALLSEIRDRVERGHRRGFVSDDDYARVNDYIPAKLQAISLDDLPEAIARPFVDHEGKRGRVVFIVPTVGK